MLGCPPAARPAPALQVGSIHPENFLRRFMSMLGFNNADMKAAVELANAAVPKVRSRGWWWLWWSVWVGWGWSVCVCVCYFPPVGSPYCPWDTTSLHHRWASS